MNLSKKYFENQPKIWFKLEIKSDASARHFIFKRRPSQDTFLVKRNCFLRRLITFKVKVLNSISVCLSKSVSKELRHPRPRRHLIFWFSAVFHLFSDFLWYTRCLKGPMKVANKQYNLIKPLTSLKINFYCYLLFSFWYCFQLLRWKPTVRLPCGRRQLLRQQWESATRSAFQGK